MDENVTFDFLTGGGEMSELIRSKDWSKTAVGPIESWPQSLLTTVSLCLTSSFPINIVWGREHLQIYNDAYRFICGNAHPRSLGENYRVTWESAWPAIGDSFERALNGEAVYTENQRMFLHRLGPERALEETYFTFSHSPIRDESGGVGGLFHPVTETTSSMLAQRRSRTLSELSTSLGKAEDELDVAKRSVAILAQLEWDLPFLLIYRFDEDAGIYRLVGQNGLEPGTESSPSETDPAADTPWPFASALNNDAIVEVDNIVERFQGRPCGPYDELPNYAFVLPISIAGVSQAPLLIVAGASSRLPMTDPYRNFYQLLRVTIAGALANVRAREDERRRAEALAEIDKAKTAFFSNVSHEFRTPLTLILGPLEEALNNDSAASQNSGLAIAHRNGLRLMRLVNSLLDFSRAEAGRIEARFEPTDLAVATAELASTFQSACEHANLKLIVDTPPLPEPAFIDRNMWEKIVLNLISNAFKFTLDGEIEIRVEAEPDAALLTVRDTGHGIPADQLPRVFERFHRVENSQGRTHEGSGIGLALVHELVKLHKGTVHVESEEGVGSTFSVRIPFGTAHLPAERVKDEWETEPVLAQADAYVAEALRWLGDDDASTVNSSPATAREAKAGNHARILVADDNADMRDYVKRLLSARWEVEAVRDGEAALAAARRQRPNLILSDVMMPRMDGFAFISALRADPSLRDLPVILLSARAGEDAKIEGLDAGADDYLVKPFASRELIARIQTNLQLAQVRKETAEALCESEARFHTMADNAPVMIWMTESDGQCSFLSRSWYEFTGQTPETGLGSGRLDTVHPDDRDIVAAQLQSADAGRGRLSFEYRLKHVDGEYRWAIDVATPRIGADGEFLGYIGSVLDITERKQAEEHTEMLLREVNHRSKNMLSLVQAVARQTAARSPDDFLARFSERLQSLAASQDLLVEAHWRGVALKDLIVSQLAHFRELIGNRILLNGPDVTLRAPTAQALGMAFYELATNAGKYGAISGDAGRVEISWTLEPAEGQISIFEMTWSESGGPTVTPPADTGFGTTVIDTLLQASLNGEVDIDYAPDGLTWRVRCGMENVSRGIAKIERAPDNGSPRKEFAGNSVLVVDDEPLIAMEVTDIIKGAGFEVLGPAHSVSEAIDLIERSGCDYAVLDVNLGPEETSEPVAARLYELGVPFVVITGYSKQQQPDAFRKSRTLSKPIKPVQLIDQIKLMASS